MRIMTTNIWGDFFGNPVEPRLEDIYSVYKNYSPDIIGFQEITASWSKSGLFEKLSDEYSFVGTHILDKTNFAPLAVKKGYEALAVGFEDLFDTDDTSKVITWAVIKKKDDDKVFGVCNTHFWWMARDNEDNRVREKNAVQMAKLMEHLSKRFDCPVFAFGDMNCTRASNVFNVVYPSFKINHLFDIAENRDDISSYHGDPIIGENGVCIGKKTENPHVDSIDHIIGYGDGFDVKQYRIVEDKYALDSSDHSPVYVDIELK